MFAFSGEGSVYITEVYNQIQICFVPVMMVRKKGKEEKRSFRIIY